MSLLQPRLSLYRAPQQLRFSFSSRRVSLSLSFHYKYSAAFKRPSTDDHMASTNGKPPPQRLVLCFDGTGNHFKGSPADTNIVKLSNMLDRANPHQMHYYQPGIGTYPDEGPVNVGFFRRIARKYEALADKALATSFDAHVIAGYRFIMRYYNEGDRIYIFGFSRGAFTARFLSRMISHVGILSRGNDEMVPFAYKVYQEYEQNRGTQAEEEQHEVFMNSFKRHFCRTERDAALSRGETISHNESGIKVHFLGLFDCVNSVGTLDGPFFKKVAPLPKVSGTARHIRHAVSIDERRVKFKVALFSQERTAVEDDIKEVWFAGNHGDIGGGWSDVSKSKVTGPTVDPKDDYFQLSDITLKWMVDEIDDVEQNAPEGERFAWEQGEKVSFLKRFQDHKKEMAEARVHDTMKLSGGGRSRKSILMWNLMEYLPLIKRWEFVKDATVPGGYKWDYICFPLNRGGRRDIPSTALFHHSVMARMREDPNYLPTNNLWIKRDKSSGPVKDDKELTEQRLDELAKRYKERGSKEFNGVTEGESQTVAAFVHDESLTRGSVEVSGEKIVELEPYEWDRIYRVQLS